MPSRFTLPPLPLALATICAVVLAAAVSACGPSTAGRVITWPSQSSAYTPSTAGPIATSSATPAAQSGGISGGIGWSQVWRQLNQNTEDTARGEYAIIVE